MLSETQARQWDEDGFFVIRGFAPPEAGLKIEAEAIAAIRADPPSAHPGKPAYVTGEGLIIQPEAKPTESAHNAEDLIAKVFNPHLFGAAEAFARDARLVEILAGLLGEDVDVFQSQFIFKNRGAWGQPWHQDSFYFPFDQQPQIGVWLAISEATLENGCLSVLPGSHKSGLFDHGPDDRPGANQGYLEVKSVDAREAQPMLMEPGDLLIFHSYLLHRSEDNRARSRRSAIVYHYSRAGVQPVVELAPVQKKILQWRPVRRRAA